MVLLFLWVRPHVPFMLWAICTLGVRLTKALYVTVTYFYFSAYPPASVCTHMWPYCVCGPKLTPIRL